MFKNILPNLGGSNDTELVGGEVERLERVVVFKALHKRLAAGLSNTVQPQVERAQPLVVLQYRTQRLGAIAVNLWRMFEAGGYEDSCLELQQGVQTLASTNLVVAQIEMFEDAVVVEQLGQRSCAAAEQTERSAVPSLPPPLSPAPSPTCRQCCYVQGRG